MIFTSRYHASIQIVSKGKAKRKLYHEHQQMLLILFHKLEIENYKSPKSWLSKNFLNAQFNQVKFIDNCETNKDLLIMGLRLTKGIKINSLLDTSIITNEKMLNLKNENIVNISKGIIKVNKNHLIRLNSILKYLMS